MTSTREYLSRVWCCLWETCGGVDVPGFSGGGEAMLCQSCELERLVEQQEKEAA